MIIEFMYVGGDNVIFHADTSTKNRVGWYGGERHTV